MTQLRKHYRANRLRLAKAKFRANQRAAKECKRLERVARDEPMPDTSNCYVPAKAKPSGFRITITCLDDGERVSLTLPRGPWGLFPSVTRAVEKVRCVLSNYRPIQLT